MRCPICPRRSADGWSRSTCSTAPASGCRLARRRSPADEPSFQRGDRGPLFQRRYWRGPTWINAAWLLWLGLRRLGYEEAASELVHRVGRTVARSGLREYYDPITGAGLGQPEFAWSTLVLELTEPDPRAAASYL